MLNNKMSTFTIGAQDPLQAAPSSRRWLVSAPYDLSFFVLSGLFGFAFWALYAGLVHWGWEANGLAILMTYFVFTALFDLPHIFQSFSRTHGDPLEFQRRRRLYTWGLPLLMGLGFLTLPLGLEAWIIGLAALYGSYHIVRQHAGLVRMYQQLNEPQRRFDQRLDIVCLQGALYSFVFYDYVELSDEPLTRITIYGQHYGLFPVLPEWLGNVCVSLGLGCVGILIWRQLELKLQGKALNWPKLLLMAMAILTHFCLFVLAALPFLVAEAVETAFHTIQYQGFVGYYQRKRFPQKRNIVKKWLCLSLVFGLIVGSVEILSFLSWPISSLLYLAFLPMSMLTLFHYYIDGKLWKFSQNPELKVLFNSQEAV